MLLKTDIEKRLYEYVPRGLEDLATAGNFVFPRYDGLSIANIPTTVARILGEDLPNCLPTLQSNIWRDWGTEIRRVVLVIIDALGYLQLERAIAAEQSLSLNHLMNRSQFIPLTSVFPSTTVAALTSLWTGRAPAEHAMLAYEVYLREFGVIANMVALKPVLSKKNEELVDWGLDLEKFLPVSGLPEMFKNRGIEPRALLPYAIIKSGLSSITMRGIEKIDGYVSQADMWVQTRHILETSTAERMFLCVYRSAIDAIGHRYGPSNAEWTAELRHTFFGLEEELLNRLSPEVRRETLLLITSDHGMMSIQPKNVEYIMEHPALYDNLTLPMSGEGRVPFLYVRDGQRDLVKNYINEELGHKYIALDAAQLLKSGIFGHEPWSAETPHRAGDVIVLTQPNMAMSQREKSFKMLGRHGGLSPEEMLCPLIATRLDD